MRLRKSSAEGIYKPTLFHLSINKSHVLDQNNLIKDAYDNIFFHEYIHYLQDILTSFGLRNFSKLVRQFSVINHEILDSSQPHFTIPYKTSNQNLQDELDMFDFIWGTDDLGNGYQDFEVTNVELEPQTFNPRFSWYNRVSINIFYRNTLDKDAFYLGAIHFMEAMAYILEKNFDYSANVTPFPYKVVEKVVRHLFPSGYFTDKNIILICEATLDSHDPAAYFYSFCQYCENASLPFTEESISSFKRVYKQSWDNVTYQYKNFYYPNAAYAKKAFKAMFIHEGLQSLNKWSHLVMTNAIKIRRSGFSFTELLVVNGDNTSVKKILSRLITKLGTPIMTDKDYGIFLNSPEGKIPADEMIYLLPIEAVLNILNGDEVCSVADYCSNGKHGVDITDANCYVSPWERTNHQPLCLLAKLWIMWGFVKKGTKK